MQQRMPITRRKFIVSASILVLNAALGPADSALAKASKYKIIYKLNGGELPEATKLFVKQGRTLPIKKLSTPTRYGYSFVGWCENKELSVQAKCIVGDKCKATRRIYAKWETVNYSITYNLNGGELPKDPPVVYTIEELPLTLLTPTKCENLAFAGWHTDDVPEVSLSAISDLSLGNLNLFANWQPCWSEVSERRTAQIASEKTAKSLTLLHFSDIHGSQADLERIVAFIDAHPNLVDAAICTGDLVTARFKDGMEFWRNVPGANRILTCIGNHDYLTSDEWDWSMHQTMSACAEAYIDPFVESWGENIEHLPNTTYYAKDFRTQQIRLIVLDCTLLEGDMFDQTTWFEQQLANAKESAFAVLVAFHYPSTRLASLRCQFTTRHDPYTGSTFSDYDKLIKSFVDNGGEFVCYLTGHIHQDRVTYDPDTPDQIDIGVSCASSDEAQNRYDNIQRTKGCFSQDLFNLVRIDRTNREITIYRIGADTDDDGHKRETCTINY